jgi:hypothetical protein
MSDTIQGGSVVVKAVRFGAFVVLAVFAFVAFPLAASARVHNDYIVVLDTSYSMSGKGGRDIFADVKKSLNSYVDKVQKGDSLTFITFDSAVKLYPPVTVDTDNSRDIVKKYLSVIEAKGEWTYTVEMLRTVIKTAGDLRSKDASRQQVIVIMTDAQDDPPPAKRGDKIDIKSLAKTGQGSDWFIYLIDTGDLDKNPAILKLKGQLAAMSPNIQLVGKQGGVGGALDAAAKDADEKSAKLHRPIFLHPVFILAVLFLIIIAIVWYIKRLSKIKLDGVLEYWSNDTFHKDVMTVDLSKFDIRKLGIGKDGDVRLRLRDFSSRKPLILEAVSIGGKIFPAIAEALSGPVEYLGKKGTHLVDGDTFKAGSYTFVFHQKK